jgi:hypothetical protein
MLRERQVEYVGSLCGILFNTLGFLHEWLKENDMVDFDGTEPTKEMKERINEIKQTKETQVG